MFKQSRTPTTIEQQHFIKEMLNQDFQLNNFFLQSQFLAANSLQPNFFVIFLRKQVWFVLDFLHWKMKSRNASSLSK